VTLYADRHGMARLRDLLAEDVAQLDAGPAGHDRRLIGPPGPGAATTIPNRHSAHSAP
jgi:hypothetical protein